MPAATDSQRPPRTDGEASRARLLQAGLRLFAQQGFSKTSTRELAEAAQVNVAAISYYFGDKAGLYRATFLSTPDDDLARYSDPALTLAQALRGFYEGFLEPLKHGDTARLCMKLHVREMLEPTGLWAQEIEHSIKPMHDQLLQVLCQHLGVAEADADVQRLAVCLAGLGVHLHVSHDVIDQLAPGLGDSTAALAQWADRLVMFGLAMVDAEKRRRTGKLKGSAR
jgi:TetR/AcrR family transcriptional regulator, regulator of cefoperazone and chloramphenicol sensitivity